jgi:hypothetical protein
MANGNVGIGSGGRRLTGDGVAGTIRAVVSNRTATIKLRPISLLLYQMLCITRFSNRSLPWAGFDQATVPTTAVVGPATTASQ